MRAELGGQAVSSLRWKRQREGHPRALGQRGKGSSRFRNLWAAPPEGGVVFTARAPGCAARERSQGRAALHRQDPCGLRTFVNELKNKNLNDPNPGAKLGITKSSRGVIGM